MEQYIWFAVTLAFGGFMFWLGQNSVKLVGQRVETLRSSDQLTIQRTVAEPQFEDPYAPPVKISPVKSGVVAPPEYRHLVEQWHKEQEGN